MLPCPLGPRLLPLLPLLALAGASNLTGLCESEMNVVKDLLQVSCEGKGLASVPQGLPLDTGILLLASNRLAHVSMASFQHLKNLTELDLSSNSLVALQTGAPLPRLQQLALSHNALLRLPPLEGLPGLLRLALGHNALAQLPEGAFQGLAKLQELELQGNQLRRLPPGAFQGLAKLKDLDLSDNVLEELPGGLLAGLAGLEILRLERNRLRALPGGFFPKELELVLAYAYLEGNPWRCDCQLEYLRGWILENELSIYTRRPGDTKEITENDPASVRCQAPPKEKGRPVMLFQAKCRAVGDGEGGEGESEAPESHTALPASTPSFRPPAGLTAPPSTAPLSTPRPPTAPAGSTPGTSTTSPDMTPAPTGPPTAAPRTSAPAAVAAATKGPPTATPSGPAPAQTPTPTMATAGPSTGRTPTPTPTAAAHAFLPSTPAPARTPTTLPATTPLRATAPPPAPPKTPAAAAAPPRERTAAASRPPATASSGAAALLPGTPSHCPCPWLPARALGVSSRPPGSWAGWLVARCCLLRLVLGAACLLLVALPSLAGLGWLGWLHLSGSHPAWQGPALGGQGARAPPLQAATSKGGQLRSPRGGRPLAVPRTYRVCREFQVGPSRHTSWLLISLPGPARHGPWGGRRGASSSYSLDRGRDAIGAVRVKYAAAATL